ncbi:MAG: hypothetical protein M1823_007185, partial [Watsoniomyces obsoletus]
GEQTVAIVKGGLRIVDGARTDDYKEAAPGISGLDDGCAFLAAGLDSGFGRGGLRDFVLEKVRRGEGVVAADWHNFSMISAIQE